MDKTFKEYAGLVINPATKRAARPSKYQGFFVCYELKDLDGGLMTTTDEFYTPTGDEAVNWLEGKVDMRRFSHEDIVNGIKTLEKVMGLVTAVPTPGGKVH